MDCINGLCVKFKSPKKIFIGVSSGRPVIITVPPHEYIDIDLNTGKFYVVNRFTGDKMKLVSKDEEIHIMDKRRLVSFLAMVRKSQEVSFWGKDSSKI